MAASHPNQDETKGNQEKLRQQMLEKDQGVTYGYVQKDPCSKERQLSYQCLDYQRDNAFIDCKDYFENVNNCKKFWVNEKMIQL
jgi:hypothetical protein